MSIPTKAFIALIALAGAASIGFTLPDFESSDPIRYLAYAVIALLASGLKVSVPTMGGTLSVNFLFVLIGILEFSLPETLLLACTVTLVQCVWRPPKQPSAAQVLFNVATVAMATLAADAAYHSNALGTQRVEEAIRILATTVVFFLLNSVPVALIISLTERKPLTRVWSECFFWSLPYYLAGAGIAGVFHVANNLIGWQTSTLAMPVAYLIYRTYRLYVGRLDDEVKHAEEMASLHLRTIEALALAIEAKDHTTHGHLRRVQVYAVEIGRDLGLADDELEALRAASVLHDIGKLAVPEHIISKPGRLTPEEFEKMKIHPVVGAEIVEQVQFPYPVAPIVRAHHEKWDGTGYPAGLKGDQIPLGARILSVVDCLDAIATDRQYRRALPLDQALAVVVGDAGKAFDPQVVKVLQRRCAELEKKAQAHNGARIRLSTDMKIERGRAPAVGLEAVKMADRRPATPSNFLGLIAAAHQEVQALFELAQDLGASLSLDETLSVLAVRLKRMVPYDSMAIYVPRDDHLHPVYVTGENFRLFSSLEIPVGQGLSGWVAEARKPLLNGNPSVESGYLNDPSKFSTLRSALVVPLEGLGGLVGVLALYQSEREAFSRDHLRILLAISGKIALSVENALKYRLAETSATTDYLTGLPNARSLFVHLDGELSRCRRLNLPLAVLVCDLDGFKLVNDRFGHLEGNRLLKAVSIALRETCREYDYVARMGGDEFVLVLPGLRLVDLEAKAARLSLISAVAGKDVFGENCCTLSIGAAFYPEDGADAEQLLAEADRRMYKSKQSHRAEAEQTALVRAGSSAVSVQ